jgi:hypothetical protein
MNVEIDWTARDMANEILPHGQLLILESLNILLVTQCGVEWGRYNSNLRVLLYYRIPHPSMRVA